VFFFVDALAHGLETPFLLDRLYESSVDDQVAERCAVLIAASCCSAGEVVVMRWEQKEDTLAVEMSVMIR
jgi:hypothetical protein